MRYLKIDVEFLNDARFVRFSEKFTCKNLAIGAWLRGIILICSKTSKKVSRDEWDRAQLPIELLNELFALNGDIVQIVRPTYCAQVGVNLSAKMSPEQLMDLWNAKCGRLPKSRELSSTRRQKALLRLAECDDEKEWTTVIKWLTQSDWHTGNNSSGWKATFDFLLKPETRIKIMERLARNEPKESFEEW